MRKYRPWFILLLALFGCATNPGAWLSNTTKTVDEASRDFQRECCYSCVSADRSNRFVNLCQRYKFALAGASNALAGYNTGNSNWLTASNILFESKRDLLQVTKGTK